MYSFSSFEPVCCSMSGSNCCFLTYLQVSQEADKVVCIPISFRIFHSLLWSTQAGIKIARRNINKLRYVDDTTLIAESQEELKSLFMKVRVKKWKEWKSESGKVGLKLNIQTTKIMASGPITSWQTDGETMETVTDFIFLGSKITMEWLQPWN